MLFEHTVVVPLGLSEARRLLDEFERRVPALPGLVVRVELAVVDARSTSVRLRGELAASPGLRSAVLLETGMRVLRRYAGQLVAAAAARARERENGPPADTAPGLPPDDVSTVHRSQWGATPVRAEVPLLQRPATWLAVAVGVTLLARSRRRRRD